MKLHIQFAPRKMRERQMPGVSSVFMTLCAFPFYYRSGCHYDVSHTATGLPSESDISESDIYDAILKGKKVEWKATLDNLIACFEENVMERR